MALLSTPLLRLHGWVALCVLWLAGSLCAAATPTRWQPPANSLLSIIFTNVPKQLPDLLAVVGEADLVELDAFDTSAATIAALHDRGLKVLCYVNFGALETWRADARQFPAAVIGSAYQGWPNEYWLDIRRTDVLLPLLAARITMARDKGCDGIDSDNLNGYEHATGFPLTRADQVRFNLALADTAHQLGMPISMKNGWQMAADMAPAFDWLVLESCYRNNGCRHYAPFVQANKAVFQLEYDNADFWTEELCPYAAAQGTSAMIVNRELDGWRAACNLSLRKVMRFLDVLPSIAPQRPAWPLTPIDSAQAYTFRCSERNGDCLGVRGEQVFYRASPSSPWVAEGRIQDLAPNWLWTPVEGLPPSLPSPWLAAPDIAPTAPPWPSGAKKPASAAP